MRLTELFDVLAVHEGPMAVDWLVEQVRAVDLRRSDIEHAIRFQDDHYARTLIDLGEHHAALVLCWKPGQGSPIHDHRGSACVVRVLEGEVVERTFDRDEAGWLHERGSHVLREGCVCGSFDEDIHMLVNETSDRPLVTMHIYTPPLEDYRLYTRHSTEVRVCSDEETLAAQARRRAESAAGA